MKIEIDNSFLSLFYDKKCFYFIKKKFGIALGLG